MKTRFSFLDPGAVMGVIVALIILSVGIFAFFITIRQIGGTTPSATTTYQNNWTYYTQQNITTTSNQVFNILGVVLIIGAIMSIVGLVYNYVR